MTAGNLTHERLRLDLMAAARNMASAPDEAAFVAARDGLVGFCFTDLLPHLARDEGPLQVAEARADTALLARAMRAEARAIRAAAYDLATASGRCEAVAATRVMHTLLAAHANHQSLLETGA